MAIPIRKNPNRVINTWDFQGALDKKINKGEFILKDLKIYSYRN